MRSPSTGVVVLALVAIGWTGCSKVLGLDDLIPDQRSGPTCSSSCGTPNCGQCPTSPTVAVPGRTFQIDAHEVTINEYGAFLAINHATKGQGSLCKWNDSFEPGWISQGARDAADELGNEIDDESCKGWFEAQASVRGNRPVACVDQCDAAAYCAWAGRHLCGKIDGGTVDVSSPDHVSAATDPEQSEWYTACSSGGLYNYPYGQMYMKGVCNDGGNDVQDVGSLPGCLGGPPDVYDMSGNVNEWTNECTSYGGRPAAAQNCLRRGGVLYDDAANLSCGKDGTGMTMDHQSTLSLPSTVTGFRCCL